MFKPSKTAQAALCAAFLLSLGLTSGSALAQSRNERQAAGRQSARGPAEPQRDPRGYRAADRPPEVASRPTTLDRNAYNHNFTAVRNYAIGPYHPPRGFTYRRYGYGDVLPTLLWSPSYYLADFWLFGLDVPPVGYEWVRYGPDALLVDIRTGTVVQAVYGCFR